VGQGGEVRWPQARLIAATSQKNTDWPYAATIEVAGFLGIFFDAIFFGVS
jgi:hypothetical protein